MELLPPLTVTVLEPMTNRSLVRRDSSRKMRGVCADQWVEGRVEGRETVTMTQKMKHPWQRSGGRAWLPRLQVD